MRVLLVAGISLVAASPGYIKNAVLTGNPVYPYLNATFPSRDWTLETDRELKDYLFQFGERASSLRALPDLPYRVLWWRSSLLFWLVPLLFFFRPFPSVSRWALTYFLAFAFLWFLISQQSRLVMPAHAILAFALGGGIVACLSRFKSGTLRGTAVTVLILLHSADVMHRNTTEAREAWPVVLGRMTRRDYLDSKIPDFGIWRGLPDADPRERVFLYNDSRSFYLRSQWVLQQFIGSAKWKRFATAEEAHAFVNETGSTLFHLNLHRSHYIHRESTERFLEKYARLMRHGNASYLFDLTGGRGEPYVRCHALTGRVSVRASSERFDAAGAVDGEEHRRFFRGRKGGWMSARIPSPESPEWLELDFGGEVRIRALQLFSFPDAGKTLTSFRVLALREGASEVLHEVKGNETQTEWFVNGIDRDLSVLRIEVTESTGPARILEVRARLEDVPQSQ